jgi:hypothetical protein
MRIDSPAFLVLNISLAFYIVGTIWAHEIDIFRSWKLVDAESFHTVQSAHWHKLLYWVFVPFGFAVIGGVLLIWYHPANTPSWAIYGALISQLLALVLTALLRGRWQARLAGDPLGSQSPYLHKILRTHWIRTLLVNCYAVFLLIASIAALGGS